MKKTNFSGRIAALAGICSMAASAASAELVTVNLFDSVNTNGEVMTVPNNYFFGFDGFNNAGISRDTADWASYPNSIAYCGYTDNAWKLSINENESNFVYTPVNSILTEGTILNSSVHFENGFGVEDQSYGYPSIDSASFSIGDMYYIGYTDNIAGTQVYGYVQFKILDDTYEEDPENPGMPLQSGSMSVIGYAYDLSGADVTVVDLTAAVPEPETCGIAAGAAALGIAALARRRRKAEDAA
jgi:hypothetical protein